MADDIRFKIEPNGKTSRLFQSLVQNGVSPPEMDGDKDREISREEVWDFAFERYEKFQNIIEGVTGSALPWSIIEGQLKSVEAKYLQETGRNAITFLEQLLRRQGYAPDSDEYRERLSIGLFYFACAPSPLRMTAFRNNILEIFPGLQEVKAIGLHDFADYILEKGGWGISFLDYPQGTQKELSAIEAFKIGAGACTEASKLLFSLFRMANLNPQFTFIHARDAVEALKPLLTVPPKVEGWGHMFVTIPLSNRSRNFDPLNGTLSNAPYHKKESPLSLREYYQADLLNQVTSAVQSKKDPEEFSQLIEEMGHTNIMSFRRYFIQAQQLLIEDKVDEAVHLLEKGIEEYPAAGDLRAALYQIYQKHYGVKEMCAKSKKHIKVLMESPDFKADAMYGINRCALMEWRNNREWFELLKMGAELYPDDPRFQEAYGYALMMMGDYSKADHSLNLAILYATSPLDEFPVQLWGHLSRNKMLQKKWLEAKSACQFIADHSEKHFMDCLFLSAYDYWKEGKKNLVSESAESLLERMKKNSHNPVPTDQVESGYSLSEQLFRRFPLSFWKTTDFGKVRYEYYRQFSDKADISSNWHLLKEITRDGLQFVPNDPYLLKEQCLALRELKDTQAPKACEQYKRMTGF